MDENTKHIVASNLTAAFYAGYVRSTEYKDADELDRTVKMTYTGFLYWLDNMEKQNKSISSEHRRASEPITSSNQSDTDA